MASGAGYVKVQGGEIIKLKKTTTNDRSYPILHVADGSATASTSTRVSSNSDAAWDHSSGNSGRSGGDGGAGVSSADGQSGGSGRGQCGGSGQHGSEDDAATVHAKEELALPSELSDLLGRYG